jgi:Helix-turn-helix domain
MVLQIGLANPSLESFGCPMYLRRSAAFCFQPFIRDCMGGRNVIEKPDRALTVRQVAYFFRVRVEKVRSWINRGELKAVNVAGTEGAKKKFRITPAALAEFEKRRSAVPPPKAAPRMKRPAAYIDFFPEL